MQNSVVRITQCFRYSWRVFSIPLHLNFFLYFILNTKTLNANLACRSGVGWFLMTEALLSLADFIVKEPLQVLELQMIWHPRRGLLKIISKSRKYNWSGIATTQFDITTIVFINIVGCHDWLGNLAFNTLHLSWNMKYVEDELGIGSFQIDVM